MSVYYKLRMGRYQDVLRDVTCDLVLGDPPYSERTHEGHDAGAETANKARVVRASGVPDTGRPRREISYDYWTPADVFECVAFWAARCRGWMVLFSDSVLTEVYRAAYEDHGLCSFQPVPLVIPGMTVRMSGDGPSSWAVYANVARPRRAPFSTWGTLPGAYVGPIGQHERAESAVAGAKPEWAMRAIVREYSRPGQVVVDPCMGGGTAIVAAAIEGRHAIGAEVDEATFRKAQRRLERGFTPVFPGMEAG